MARNCTQAFQRLWRNASPSVSSAIAAMKERFSATNDLATSFVPGFEAENAPCIFVFCINGVYLVISVKSWIGF